MLDRFIVTGWSPPAHEAAELEILHLGPYFTGEGVFRLTGHDDKTIVSCIEVFSLPGGRPVETGYISSLYGQRTDPFDGNQATHRGIDFAGVAGTEVLAVADGIVSHTGLDGGYGRMIEVTHGDGYVTRYAHNAKILVKPGQTVKRGDAIALMGSTGRSTGPHVHFEVLRNGKPMNPLAFVKR